MVMLDEWNEYNMEHRGSHKKGKERITFIQRVLLDREVFVVSVSGVNRDSIIQ